MLEKIAAILAETMDCDPAEITEETSFHDLGLDSLDIMELLVQINEASGVKVEPNSELKTVGDVIAKIGELQAC